MTLDAITIRLDDRVLRLPTGATLTDLLEQADVPATSVATALNGRFIARAARASTPLVEGDQVLLFQPIVGG